MSDGEEMSAITLVVLVLDPIVQVTVSAILPLMFAHVTKAGLAKGAKYLTAQETLTALIADYATPLWIPQSVKTAPRDGWDRHAMIRVNTVNRFQWIAVTVFVSQAGLVQGAIANVRSMEPSSMTSASVMLDGVEHFVKIPDALERARIVLVMESVTVLFIDVSARMGGLVTDVIFLTVLEIQTVQIEVKIIHHNEMFCLRFLLIEK